MPTATECGKWDALTAAMAADQQLCGARLTSRELSCLYHGKRAVLRETSEEIGSRRIFGFAGCWKTSDKAWCEIGTVWVSSEHRGAGLGSALIKEVLALPKAQVRLFALSRNPRFVSIALSLGFRAVCAEYQPEFELREWWNGLGLKDRELPHTLREPFSNTGESRWLLIRP
jgi:GNAT superfamily N-acetyltransferase